MTGWRALGGTVAAALVGAAVAVAVLLALGGLSRGGSGEAVRAYILDHPDIIPQAMQRLQDRHDEALVAANRAQIVTPFPGAEAGNPKGDVTVTEFYDYACGYCRQSVGDLDRLAAADKGVHLVFKELPVLSAYSDQAARFGLAAAKAGRFSAFHHALFGAGALDPQTMAAAARTASVDPASADDPTIAREIEATMDTARALGLNGTPVFIVGDRILSGAVGYAALQDAVAAARQRQALGSQDQAARET